MTMRPTAIVTAEPTPVDGDDALLVTLTGEIHVKSKTTRNRFRRAVQDNLSATAARQGLDLDIEVLDPARLLVRGDDLEGLASAAAHTFGVHRIERTRAVDFGDLDELAQHVLELAGASVTGRTFAVRVRRHGSHDWSSLDAERVLGQALLARSAGVDLDTPDVEVPVMVVDDRARIVDRTWDGPGGLPLGTQEPVLSLLSGGFDSPVATWMMMRRGCPVDLLHIRLDCAQTDHALAVAYGLWRQWGARTSPVAWVVDFEDIEAALHRHVQPRLRQVVLKQLMVRAANRMAEEVGARAIVTGDAVGQVSSQTLTHLAEIDSVSDRLILRPLAGFDKQEIITWSRRVGTHDLSARAKEMCNLAGDHRVAVAAQGPELDKARGRLPEGLLDAAVERREVIALEHWFPGVEAVPVLADRPAEAHLVRTGDDVPEAGALAFAGRDAIHRATRHKVAGRDVTVLTRRGPGSAD